MDKKNQVTNYMIDNYKTFGAWELSSEKGTLIVTLINGQNRLDDLVGVLRQLAPLLYEVTRELVIVRAHYATTKMQGSWDGKDSIIKTCDND